MEVYVYQAFTAGSVAVLRCFELEPIVQRCKSGKSPSRPPEIAKP